MSTSEKTTIYPILRKRNFMHHFGCDRKEVRKEIKKLAFFLGLYTEASARSHQQFEEIFLLLKQLDEFFGDFRCYPDVEPQ